MQLCQFTKLITPQGCPNYYRELFECNKQAIVFIDGKHLCRHHARLGRYIIRIGDVGEILFRCNTKEELIKEYNSGKYTKSIHRMQYKTKSKRRTLNI